MVSAVHLEMHDQHMTSDPAFQAWLAGESAPQEPAVQYRAYTERPGWLLLISSGTSAWQRG